MRLSERLHATVIIRKPLAKETLSVDPRTASPLQELQAVALALHARAVAETGGWTIARPPEEVAEIVKARIAQKREALAATLQGAATYRRARLAGRPLAQAVGSAIEDQAQGWEKYLGGNGKMPQIHFVFPHLFPCETLLEATLKKLDIEKLCGYPDGEIHLYENAPTSCAIPLPNLEEELARYERELQSLQDLRLTPQQLEAASVGFGLPE